MCFSVPMDFGVFILYLSISLAFVGREYRYSDILIVGERGHSFDGLCGFGSIITVLFN